MKKQIYPKNLLNKITITLFKNLPVFCAVLALLFSGPAMAQTAFTYQGRLQQNDSPTNGDFDMKFDLFDNLDATPPATGSVTETVTVSDGLFTVELDFGAVFDGTPFWLEVSVREDSGTGYTPISPLQPLTPAPYAIFALNSTTSQHSHPPSHNSCTWVEVKHASAGPRESFCPVGSYTAGVRANETSDNEADISYLYCCSP